MNGASEAAASTRRIGSNCTDRCESLVFLRANPRQENAFKINALWRREWDSNPRYSFPHTRFPSVRLKPLGHLSGGPSLEGTGRFLQANAAACGQNSVKLLN